MLKKTADTLRGNVDKLVLSLAWIIIFIKTEVTLTFSPSRLWHRPVSEDETRDSKKWWHNWMRFTNSTKRWEIQILYSWTKLPSESKKCHHSNMTTVMNISATISKCIIGLLAHHKQWRGESGSRGAIMPRAPLVEWRQIVNYIYYITIPFYGRRC